jgi:hypothetical protein
MLLLQPVLAANFFQRLVHNTQREHRLVRLISKGVVSMSGGGFV